MVTHDSDRICDVEQQQASDDDVEWLGVAPARDVAMSENDSGVVSNAAPGLFEHTLGLIEADDGSLRTKQSGHELRDMTQAGSEVEDAYAGANSGGEQQQTRGGFDALRLRIKARKLLGMAAQDVSSS